MHYYKVHRKHIKKHLREREKCIEESKVEELRARVRLAIKYESAMSFAIVVLFLAFVASTTALVLNVVGVW